MSIILQYYIIITLLYFIFKIKQKAADTGWYPHPSTIIDILYGLFIICSAAETLGLSILIFIIFIYWLCKYRDNKIKQERK